jgi:hypothetical protein
MRRFGFLTAMVFVAMALGFLGWEAMGPVDSAPSAWAAKPAKAPVIKLKSVEVAHYWPFYFNAQDKAGSPLDLAFVFTIENPTAAAVKLDEFRFTVAFEGFPVIDPWVYEDQWIPPRKTNELRVHAVLDTTRVKKPPEEIKKWWDAIPDFSFPVQVKNGVANFVGADGKTTMAYFEGQFPPAK